MSDLGQSLRMARDAILAYCHHDPRGRGDRFAGNSADAIISGYMERTFGDDDLSLDSPRWTYLRKAFDMAASSTGYVTADNTGGFKGRECKECGERKRDHRFYRDAGLDVLSEVCIACQRSTAA